MNMMNIKTGIIFELTYSQVIHTMEVTTDCIITMGTMDTTSRKGS